MTTWQLILRNKEGLSLKKYMKIKLMNLMEKVVFSHKEKAEVQPTKKMEIKSTSRK